MAVQIKGTFKRDERENNGLEGIREDLIRTPLERHTIVGTIEVTKIVRDVADGGVETPTVRLVSVEPLSGDDALTAKKMLDAAYHERTGQTAPPATLFDEGVPGTDAFDGGEPWPGDVDSAGDGDSDPDAKPKRGKR
jgi:hypothetical protein